MICHDTINIPVHGSESKLRISFRSISFSGPAQLSPRIIGRRSLRGRRSGEIYLGGARSAAMDRLLWAQSCTLDCGSERLGSHWYPMAPGFRSSSAASVLNHYLPTFRPRLVHSEDRATATSYWRGSCLKSRII